MDHFEVREVPLAEVDSAGLVETDLEAFAELARLDMEDADLAGRRGMRLSGAGDADHFRRRAAVWVHLAERHPELEAEAAQSVELWQIFEWRAVASVVEGSVRSRRL
ncbi:hypothetical protein ACSCBZ_41640 [Streptomyces niveiscabiei]|uniref:hypothetical protein n=1 Tax=Streptomyces niveiscabiei TaxID=164115 RepID=UPI0006EB96FF|nr:hypothetical protein [Streptomyces niveiscabiei]